MISKNTLSFDLRQLRYFLAIGDAGTLSQAARRLNVAQSAVSHHLAELEAKLGLPLVERHARGVTLTAAGERLHRHARSIIAAVATAEGDVKAYSDQAAGPVSLGLSHTVTHRASLPLLRMLRAERPDIRLGLVEAMSLPLADRLLAGELDLAVLYNPPEDARLSCIPVLEEDLHLVGRPDLLEGHPDPIPFSDILAFPLIMPHPSATSRSLIENFFLREQLPDRVMEVDSIIAITHALAEGVGCSVLATSTVSESVAAGTLVARRIVSPEIKRTLYLAELRDRPRTPAIEALRRAVLAVLGAEVASGRWEACHLANLPTPITSTDD